MLRLAALRIASPCHERWADMAGDDRARHCNACDRQVVDLSAVTGDEAEALLSSAVTPCVRFRRTAIGAVAIGAALLGATPAIAEPVTIDVDDATDYIMGEPLWPEPAVEPQPGWSPPIDDELPVPAPAAPPRRPTLAWSGWVRLGFGAEQEPETTRGIARLIAPPPDDRHPVWEAALGADLSVPLALDGDLRLGAWAEVRTSSGAVLGAELILDAPPHQLVLRAGANAHAVTTAIAFGDDDLRLVVSATRSRDDPRDASATAGVELEPVAAIRRLLRRGR